MLRPVYLRLSLERRLGGHYSLSAGDVEEMILSPTKNQTLVVKPVSVATLTK